MPENPRLDGQTSLSPLRLQHLYQRWLARYGPLPLVRTPHNAVAIMLRSLDTEKSTLGLRRGRLSGKQRDRLILCHEIVDWKFIIYYEIRDRISW